VADFGLDFNCSKILLVEMVNDLSDFETHELGKGGSHTNRVEQGRVYGENVEAASQLEAEHVLWGQLNTL
jgi:hypothetical protein